MPTTRIIDGNVISDADPLQTQDAGAAGAFASIGATTDAPFVGPEDATPRTGIGLWKGIKNVLGIISGSAVTTDTDGTIQQYLRGLVKLVAAKITVGIDQVTANANKIQTVPYDLLAADYHAPAVHTAAVVTMAATPGLKHRFDAITGGYSGGLPAVGCRLNVTVDSAEVRGYPIVDEGPFEFTFPGGAKQTVANKAVVITLSDGGVGITGGLNVEGHKLEA